MQNKKQTLDNKYKQLVREILTNGEEREDRTGTGTKSIFGYKMDIDLNEGFPLLTSKRVHIKSVVGELLWFLRGDTNTKFLKENGVSIWDEWEDETGDVGKMYGYQWRNLKVDQIKYVLDQLDNNPTSRRIVMNTWNVDQLDQMSLYPCHVLCQLYVGEDNKVSMQVYQRSADVGLGVPFNIASYALLLHLFCHCSIHDYTPHKLHYVFGDTHIYKNHIEPLQKFLDWNEHPLSILTLNPEKRDIDEFTFDDIHIIDYKYEKRLKLDVSV